MAALEGIGGLDLGGLRISYGKSRREGSNFVDVAVVGVNLRLLT
jgi:hypothetical protein